MKKNFYKTSVLLLVMIMTTTTSCMNYYSVKSETQNQSAKISLMNLNKKEVVIHFKDTAFDVSSISIENEVLSGYLTPLSATETKYAHPKSKKRNRYWRRDRYSVFNQIHIYTEKKEWPADQQLALPFADVSRVGTYKKNDGASVASHLLGGAAFVTALAILFSLTVDLNFDGL